jgi:TRAP-type C4-dicarboxylate transport system permease small subunit
MMLKKTSLYLNKGAGIASFIIFLSVLAIVLIDIVTRAFRIQTLWGFELVGLLLASGIGLGMGYAQLGHDHVRIEIVYSRLPSKVQNILDLINSVICFIVSVVVSWQLWDLACQSVREKITTFAVPTPIFYFQYLMFIGFVLLSLQLLVDIEVYARQLWFRRSEI